VDRDEPDGLAPLAGKEFDSEQMPLHSGRPLRWRSSTVPRRP
jgi:hypothetical protein